MQRTGLRHDLEDGRLARLEIGQAATQHLPQLDERRAVRDHALDRRPVAIEIVLRRQRVGIVIDDAADGRVHREGDCNHVIESRHQVHMAVSATTVTAEILERAKTVDDAGADRADQDPGHLEKTKRRRVQEEIDRLLLLQALVGGEPKRIDAEQLNVACRADVALEFRDQTRAPRPRRFQRGQLLFEKPLVNRSHGSSPTLRAAGRSLDRCRPKVLTALQFYHDWRSFPITAAQDRMSSVGASRKWLRRLPNVRIWGAKRIKRLYELTP